MSVYVEKNVYGLTDETAVTIKAAGGYGLFVHPWDRTPRWGAATNRRVYISLGVLNKKGREKKFTKKLKREGYHGDQLAFGEIFDRDEFVEGLIQAFPELQRREVAV